jgi:dolichyl-phosphate-mannose--protein O-mannosyl transferase
MSHHPVLRNLMVYATTNVFGGTVLGVKGLSLLFGTLIVPVTGLLVRRASRDDRAGLFAAGIVALDGVQIVYSRQAINDVHASLFALIGVWLTVEALRSKDTASWKWIVPLAGLSFGLGAAEKFYALPLLALSMLLLVFSAWKRRCGDEALLAAMALGPLPFLVYLLTYIPWFGRGYDLPEWVLYQLRLIDAMASFSRPAVGFRANDEPLWWFLKPFYGHDEVAFTAAHQAHLSVAVGNPFVWLAVIPVVVYALLNEAQRRRDALLLAFFFAAYLPLAFSARQIWALSSVVVIPFAAGLIGSVLAGLSRRHGSRVAWVYGTIVVASSLLLYPLAIGRALDFGYLKPVVVQVGDYLAPHAGVNQP